MAKAKLQEVTSRNIVRDAAEILETREAAYGNILESFEIAAEICNLIFTDAELNNGPMDAQKVAKVLIALKQTRDRYTPSNPDHLRDVIGYNGILDKIRQEEANQNGGDDVN